MNDCPNTILTTNAVPALPKVCSARLTNVLMSMVLNAADRSNSTSSDLDILSAAQRTSLSSRSQAVSVDHAYTLTETC